MLTAGLPELTSVKDIQYLKVKIRFIAYQDLTFFQYMNFDSKMNKF